MSEDEIIACARSADMWGWGTVVMRSGEHYDRRRRPIEVRAYTGGMSLEVRDRPNQISWIPAFLGIPSRWEVTCGFCRTRFRRFSWELMAGSRMSRVTGSRCGPTTSCFATIGQAPSTLADAAARRASEVAIPARAPRLCP